MLFQGHCSLGLVTLHSSAAIFTFICLFIVIQKSMMKYITRIGQNTGTLKASKKVQIIATRMPFVAACLKAKGEISVVFGQHQATVKPFLWPLQPPERKYISVVKCEVSLCGLH